MRTYENDFELDFDYDGKRYTAHADCVVELSKKDVGPLRDRDHAWRYVTDKVEVEKLRVWEGNNTDWMEVIPDDIKSKAESALIEEAATRAEEFLETE